MMNPSEVQRLSIQGQIDQFAGVLKDVAPLYARYYHDLIANGVKEEVAAALVVNLQATMFGPRNTSQQS